jgi:hypothetical protein
MNDNGTDGPDWGTLFDQLDAIEALVAPQDGRSGDVDCYHCNQPMASGSARYATWGARTVIVHRACDRDALIARARELGCFEDASQRSDQQLIDAIAAEQLSGEWLDRLAKLPTDEAKRDAVHRLRLTMENPT